MLRAVPLEEHLAVFDLLDDRRAYGRRLVVTREVLGALSTVSPTVATST